ncbi:MAG: hypothetical protein HKP58_12075 [Desulfatitalea sp.]|nr:hypothetical protein [Desulfatitalea sp.]NNK01138.1 hypothetical protein [Desulfatitalea sp.]
MKAKGLWRIVSIMAVFSLLFGFLGCRKEKNVNLTPPPTGHELLLKAFEESGGETVDAVCEREVVGISLEMFVWWGQNIPDYYRLWWPEMHFVEERHMTPEGEIRGIIKEMIWPYYTEFIILIDHDGVMEFLSPDGEVMGAVYGSVTPTSKGVLIKAVHTLPAKTPQSFIDALEDHFHDEVQDLPRFLPELYENPELYEQPPTGHDVLHEAYKASEGDVVELIVDQEIAGITMEMWDWWAINGVENYRLWWPEMHFVNEMSMTPYGPRITIKEMIWPYYTEFCLSIIEGGAGFMSPDNEVMGQLTHTLKETPGGIKIHSVAVLPAMTPQSFVDALEAHINYEMQDLKRFLPELYAQKTGNLQRAILGR